MEIWDAWSVAYLKKNNYFSYTTISVRRVEKINRKFTEITVQNSNSSVCCVNVLFLCFQSATVCLFVAKSYFSAFMYLYIGGLSVSRKKTKQAYPPQSHWLMYALSIVSHKLISICAKCKIESKENNNNTYKIRIQLTTYSFDLFTSLLLISIYFYNCSSNCFALKYFIQFNWIMFFFLLR